MEKLTKYVDMTFGTGDNSLCTIGPARPHSSVNPGPDTYPQSYSTGYLPTKPIRGFSHIHVNAGEAKYGNFLFSPQIGLSTAIDSHDSEKDNENPTASEYSVTLSRYNIDCSFTPTEHSVFYKFIYPKSNEASLVIDVTHFCHINMKHISDVSIGFDKDENGNTVIWGSGLFDGMKYCLNFYATVNKAPSETGTFVGSDVFKNTDKLAFSDVSEEIKTSGAGAYLKFNTEEKEEILVKIALSFHSVEKAKEWLTKEIPLWDYDVIKKETVDIWEKTLGKIKISENATDEQKRMFYTCLYISHRMPRDRTGDFKEYGDSIMIDDHIAIWDTFRCLYPLYTIIEPDFVSKTINSFITRFKTNGYIRDVFNGGKERRRNQGGDNVDNIIAEAFFKKIPDVDWQEAYKIIKENAENWRDDQNSWVPMPSLPSTYRENGFIPADDETKNVMCCSKQLEYCYNDYLAAMMAKELGYTDDYKKYLKRSESWKNIWNPDIECAGYKGYIWPKKANGEWVEPNEYIESPIYFCLSWAPYFYEGRAFEYSFMIPHDVEGVIERMGGDELFCQRLHLGIDENYINAGNQPGMLQPYLPNHTKMPWNTTELVEKQLAKYKHDGTPGCEDSGCFASYYVFSNIGIFPNAGQDYYYLTSPKFDSTELSLEDGKKFVIRAENLSNKNKYIQSVYLNGIPHKSTTIKHSDIICGGELVFIMGSTPTNYSE